jgi:hypothetical protein
VVNTVVTTTENATGTQGSAAGDWTEEQAAKVEGVVDDATGAANEGAADAVGFVALVGDKLAQGVGHWVGGGAELQLPGRPDIGRLFTLVGDVVRVTGAKVEGRVTDWLGNALVDLGKQGAARVAGGPAPVWADVKQVVESATETLRIKLIAGTLGRSTDTSQPGRTMTQLAVSADDERRRQLAELRRALQTIEITQPGGKRGPVSPQLQLSYSNSIDGLALRRLSGELLARASGGAPTPNAEAVQHLALAATAAARAALLNAELLLWLASLKRVASQKRLAAIKPRLGGR